MKRYGFIFFLFLVSPALGLAQKDSAFAIFFNSNIGFSRAEDPHINKWLTRYGYKPEPRNPANLQFELAAIPVSSRTMFSLRAAAIVSGQSLFSLNLMAGLYESFFSNRHFLFLAGLGAGMHTDRINLNGDMPPDYLALARLYNKQLSLRRNGFIAEPALRSFWFPITCHHLRLGLFSDLGYDIDWNSGWKLGYYKQGGEYGRFQKLKKPADQQKSSAHGWALDAGLTASLHLR